MSNPASSIAVILPAAGASSRFGGGRNKLVEPLDGQPVLLRTLEAFVACADLVNQIVIPADERIEAWLASNERFQQILAAHPNLIDVCRGGACRAESVLRGLERVRPTIDWVAVHDAARPLVSRKLIERTFAAAREHGAAVPAMPVELTIKRAVGPLPAKVRETVPRRELWAMQTPQVMRRRELLQAFASCPLPLAQITDDAQLLELIGQEVWLVPGEERNLKITTAKDLSLARHFLSEGRTR